MELRDIVKAWLQEHGYDGLCKSDLECGCHISNLMPCDEPSMECEAGYSVPVPPDSDAHFWIAPMKPQEV